MQNNYIQLTKDSLGSSPTQNCTWQDQAEGKEVNWSEFCTSQVLINTSAVPWLLNTQLLGMNSRFNPVEVALFTALQWFCKPHWGMQMVFGFVCRKCCPIYTWSPAKHLFPYFTFYFTSKWKEFAFIIRYSCFLKAAVIATKLLTNKHILLQAGQSLFLEDFPYWCK